MKNIQNSGLLKLEKTIVGVFSAWFTLYSAAALETRSDPHVHNIDIYRSKTRCPERVANGLSPARLTLHNSHIGENEKGKLNPEWRCRGCQVSLWQEDCHILRPASGSG